MLSRHAQQGGLPDAEKCDGIDNECNGDIDEGKR
jgi:hypothetical protein